MVAVEDANEVSYGAAETHRELGGFWMHAQATQYVFRLVPPLRAAFARRRAAERTKAEGDNFFPCECRFLRILVLEKVIERHALLLPCIIEYGLPLINALCVPRDP